MRVERKDGFTKEQNMLEVVDGKLKVTEISEIFLTEDDIKQKIFNEENELKYLYDDFLRISENYKRKKEVIKKYKEMYEKIRKPLPEEIPTLE